MQNLKKAILFLEDGLFFIGKSLGNHGNPIAFQDNNRVLNRQGSSRVLAGSLVSTSVPSSIPGWRRGARGQSWDWNS